jgi:hydroxymethylbilane synthase
VTRPLRLGTRGSALALAQSGHVAAAVTDKTGREVELVEITTFGDISREAISQLGGTGVFVSALRDALLAREIDFAVHSYKDLPTAPAEGLVLAAVPVREDPRDVLVARDGLTLSELGAGARIGTGAPRRIAQLNALGLGLECVPIRGNVDTRIRKVTDGELDAVVLARAGLARLGRLDSVTEVIDPMLVLPAPAQGALALECRADDTGLTELLGALDDPPWLPNEVCSRPSRPGAVHPLPRGRCSPNRRPASPRSTSAAVSRRWTAAMPPGCPPPAHLTTPRRSAGGLPPTCSTQAQLT